ncbi:MAG: MarR family winged helix-turn-helix transcriptional regulator [Eubacteriales bacterium]|nr:MarR family winged helix-turn-helix transcriptional regulator [Eubacteriales bacterium]
MASFGDTELSMLFSFPGKYGKVFFEHVYKTIQQQTGIKKTQLKTLIFAHIHGGGYMSDYAEWLGIENSSFTTVADHLISLGYLKKTAGADDRRKSFLCLTEKGLEFADRSKEMHKQLFTEQIKKLPQKEQEAFFSHLSALHRLLDRLDSES